MTATEFLSQIKSRGAVLLPPPPTYNVEILNTSLQRMRCAMLPQPIMELFAHTGGIRMDTGYIFGPASESGGAPDIISVNSEIDGIESMHGRTVFGQNDLFWFAFDAFGTYMMLDNTGLRVLRKYDDAYRAMTDCLMAGKI